MNWLTDIFMGTGVAHSIFIYAIVIALGVILGKTKIKGVSLGTTFVLFVGILAGHLGLQIDPNTLTEASKGQKSTITTMAHKCVQKVKETSLASPAQANSLYALLTTQRLSNQSQASN